MLGAVSNMQLGRGEGGSLVVNTEIQFLYLSTSLALVI